MRRAAAPCSVLTAALAEPAEPGLRGAGLVVGSLLLTTSLTPASLLLPVILPVILPILPGACVGQRVY